MIGPALGAAAPVAASLAGNAATEAARGPGWLDVLRRHPWASPAVVLVLTGRSSRRSGRGTPGSASLMSASAARILLAPEAWGPTPRTRRGVPEDIVGASTTTEATNGGAGLVRTGCGPGIALLRSLRNVRHDRTLPEA